MDIQLTYNGEPRVITVNNPKMTLSKLRTLVTSQFGLGLDQSPAAWTFTVNDEPISMFQAPNRHVSDGMRVSIDYKGALPKQMRTAATRKRRRDAHQPYGDELAAQKISKAAGKDYRLTLRLLQLLRENAETFTAYNSADSMSVANICGIMGHISQNLPLHGPPFFVATQPTVITELVQRAKTLKLFIAIAPVFTMGHVSLVCLYDQGQRMIHLDASSSIGTHASEMFTIEHSQKSFCFINYQMYDEANVVVDNLQGGNCGPFACILAMHCILEQDTYRKRRFTFAEFWARFTLVLELDPDDSRQKNVLLATFRSLYYVLGGNGKAEQTYCRDLGKINVPSALVLMGGGADSVRMFLEAVIPANVLNVYDFTADVMVLDIFISLKLGIHQITIMGSVFKRYLMDFAERGLIQGPIDAQQRSMAKAPLLAAWIILKKIEKVTPDEIQTLVDALLDAKPELDDTPRLEKLESNPRELAVELIYAFQNMKQPNEMTPQVLAMKYLENLEKFENARQQGMAAKRHAAEHAALIESAQKLGPVPGTLLENITASKYEPFTVKVNYNLKGSHEIEISPHYFEKMAHAAADYTISTGDGIRRRQGILVELSYPTSFERVYARVVNAHGDGDERNTIYASPAIASALQKGTTVFAHFYEDVAVISHILFRVFSDSNSVPEDFQAQIQNYIYNWPALAVGDEMDIGGIMVRVQSVAITNGTAVPMAAMPLHDTITFDVEYETSQCQLCASISTAKCGGSVDCPTTYCGRACQELDWDAHYKNCN